MDVEHSERLLAGFLHTAQQRGEASVARARLVACLAFMAMHLPLRWHLLLVGDLKSCLIIGGLTVGIWFSWLGLRWSAAGTYFSSTPRSISTASAETLGTSTLSASGAPLRS